MAKEPPGGDEITVGEEINLRRDFPPPSYGEWKAAAEAGLKGGSFEEKLVGETYEGIDLQPLYRWEDIESLPHIRSLPGDGDYVRGTRAAGYASRPWEICQEIPAGLPGEFNPLLKHDLEKGQTAVNLLLDRTTRLGLDSDRGIRGEVGRDGLTVSTLEDLSVALAGIDLETYPLHVDCGFSALEVLMMLGAFLNREGKDPAGMRGSIAADPLAHWVTEGNLPIPLDDAFHRLACAAVWANEHAPQLRTVGVSGLPYHDSGADAVRELAYVLATGAGYLRQLQERDISIRDAAPRLRFTFGIGPFYFMEIAKLRAARMCWANIVRAFGGNRESRGMTIHGRTSRTNQTLADPYVNMLRTTTEAFSAVVGGVDSLHTNAFDESFRRPDSFSRGVARNTQVILREEAHLAVPIDPAGGSYYVESLTHRVAREAWALFQEVERRGGMMKALEAGYPQEEILQTRKRREKDAADGERVIVGTNKYADLGEKPPPIEAPDYREIYRSRCAYLRKYRSSRQRQNWEASLEGVYREDVQKTAGMIRNGAEAFAAGATIGEVAASLRQGSSPSPSIKILERYRVAAAFEKGRYNDPVGAGGW